MYGYCEVNCLITLVTVHTIAEQFLQKNSFWKAMTQFFSCVSRFINIWSTFRRLINKASIQRCLFTWNITLETVFSNKIIIIFFINNYLCLKGKIEYLWPDKHLKLDVQLKNFIFRKYSKYILQTAIGN